MFSRSLRAATALICAVLTLGEAPRSDAALLSALAAAADKTAAVRSYDFALHVDVKLHTFPYLAFALQGDGRYARPNRYTVHFHKVPWFGKGFEDVSLDALDPRTWPEHYVIDGTQRDASGRLIVLMHDKVKSPLAGARAEIDELGLRKIVWTYTYGGRIEVSLAPKLIAGYPLPATEDAEIRMPSYHVVAHARFDYAGVQTDGATAEPPAR